ncbi:hypothetical protein HanRHA438_Chr03g0139421 [Helianthus annuus]|nr:hypothetical protein HanRHA438_Chr03g0139421 [Helianthus annuus]
MRNLAKQIIRDRKKLTVAEEIARYPFDEFTGGDKYTDGPELPPLPPPEPVEFPLETPIPETPNPYAGVPSGLNNP